MRQADQAAVDFVAQEYPDPIGFARKFPGTKADSSLMNLHGRLRPEGVGELRQQGSAGRGAEFTIGTVAVADAGLQNLCSGRCRNRQNTMCAVHVAGSGVNWRNHDAVRMNRGNQQTVSNYVCYSVQSTDFVEMHFRNRRSVDLGFCRGDALVNLEGFLFYRFRNIQPFDDRSDAGHAVVSVVMAVAVVVVAVSVHVGVIMAVHVLVFMRVGVIVKCF